MMLTSEIRNVNHGDTLERVYIPYSTFVSKEDYFSKEPTKMQKQISFLRELGVYEF